MGETWSRPAYASCLAGIVVVFVASLLAMGRVPLVIERYRAETISLDYYGDSVVNALGDLAASTLGFFFAARAPVGLTIVSFVALEAALAYFIRDNLTLNVLMLVWPTEAVKTWQFGS